MTLAHWRTLDNGFRVLTLQMPHLHSLRLDLHLRVGSRWEVPETNGLSHFVEHLLFNGTGSYPSATELSLAAADIGGALNGEVGPETADYYLWTRTMHLEKAISVFSSMFTEPLFDEKEMDIERRIVLAEIAEENRRGSVDELLWPNHPLSYYVSGTRSNIRGFTRDQVIDHWRRFYVPDNLILVAMGNVDHGRVEALAEKAFGGMTGRFAEKFAPWTGAGSGPRFKFVTLMENPGYNVGLAYHAYGAGHPRRVALGLLNTILGVSDTSRLFLGVRERQGLVYTVESYTTLWTDAGALEVEFNASRRKLRPALEAVVRELHSLVAREVSDVELARAKEWQIATLESGLDDPAGLSRRYALRALFNDSLSIEETIELTEKVTAEEVLEVARDIIRPDNACLFVQGPGFNARDKREIRDLVRGKK